MAEECTVNVALEKISGRWKMQVLYLIDAGENRFSVIKSYLKGISDRILGLRLNELVEDGLIKKNSVNGEIFYTMTNRSLKLIKILDELVLWQEAIK